jgi:hypothetical protein
LNFVWVETIKEGCAKARWTVADVRGKETRDDVFSPTPSLLANRLFDVRALLRKENCVSADVVSAFPHAEEKEDVWVRAPPEFSDKVREEILAGVRTDIGIAELDAGIYIKLTANVYGRRTAGAAWRQLFEDTVCGIPGYNFVRCPHEPCAYIDYKKGVLLIHHVDDIRVTGKDQDLKFIMAHLAVKFWLKVGEIEKPGSEMKYLNRVKIRSEDSMVTIPDAKLIEDIIRLLGLETGRTSPIPGKKLSKDEADLVLLEGLDIKLYQQCVGKAIYLSMDRADIQYPTKELARRMSAPRLADMANLKVLGRYLKGTKGYAQCIKVCKGPVILDAVSDSDWKGCHETARSTSGFVIKVAGATVLTGSSTQPGLPALSSGEAELRATSKLAQEARAVQHMCDEFGIVLDDVPHLWTDSSAGRQASMRLGPGRMKHMEAADMFVQQLTSTGQMKSSKCAGVDNFADPLTKHIPRDILEKHKTNMGIIDLSGDLVASIDDNEVERKPWKLSVSRGVSRAQLKVLATLGYITSAAGTAVQVRSRDYEVFEEAVLDGPPWGWIFLWTLLCIYFGYHICEDAIKFKNFACGCLLRKKVAVADVAIQTGDDERPIHLVWTADGGDKYHYSSDCVGLSSANRRICRGLCLKCAAQKRQGMA